ncbi:MAG: GNAT family N-acetyltransferase [Myxococcota bacterium]
MVLLGGCLCGSVRYALAEAPGLVEHCHCSMCRKWHGAAFSTNAELRAGSLAWTRGETELAGYRSSPARERVFCRRCGTKLAIRRLDSPEALALCAATLDADSGVRPARHVFAADRAPWLAPTDSLPRFDVYPGHELRLRPATAADLDFVLALERDADNAPFIGHWTRAEHAAAIAASDREHWILARASDGARLGFLLAFDLRAAGLGVYVKRIAISEKSRGLGREALGRFARHAFGDLQASHLWLTVFPENERARRSYRAVGFRVDEVGSERRALLAAATGGFSARSVVMVLDRGAERP